MNMIELEQMRREWVDVTRKNGFREGITDLLAHQYSKKTHFIFELLQNAEDALATEIEFRVESQRLVFSIMENVFSQMRMLSPLQASVNQQSRRTTRKLANMELDSRRCLLIPIPLEFIPATSTLILKMSSYRVS